MLQFKDFVPKQINPPGIFSPGEYEDIEDAMRAANEWLAESHAKLINVETVVLPNIWSRYEQGTTDPSLGISGEDPSHWHQFIRCWYLDS